MPNKNKSSLIENIVSIALVQGADYLIPLLMIPYMARVLGVEGYGKIAFAQAICAYFCVVVEYGFNLSATKAVAIHKGDKSALSEIVWAVQGAKLILALISFLLLFGLVNSVSVLAQQKTLLWIAMLPVVGSFFYPLWLMQGLEKLRVAASAMLFVRIMLLASVFVFVKSKEDLHLAAALQVGGAPIAGIFVWAYLLNKNVVRLIIPKPASIWAQMIDGWHVFLAVAASTVYRSSNAVVLGFVAGPVAVAYYSICEKVVKAVQEMNRPIMQATFPRVSAYAAESKDKAIAILRNILGGVGALAMASSLGLFLFSEKIVVLLGGASFHDAAIVLKIMSLIPFVGGVNAVLGTQTMIPFNHGKPFSRLVLVAGAINIIAVFPLSFALGANGAALSYLASEIFLMIAFYRFLQLNGLGYKPSFMFVSSGVRKWIEVFRGRA